MLDVIWNELVARPGELLKIVKKLNIPCPKSVSVPVLCDNGLVSKWLQNLFQLGKKPHLAIGKVNRIFPYGFSYPSLCNLKPEELEPSDERETLLSDNSSAGIVRTAMTTLSA